MGNSSVCWQNLPSALISWEKQSHQKSSMTDLLLVPVLKHWHQDNSQNAFEFCSHVKTYHWGGLLAEGQELPCTEGDNWFHGESIKAISAIKMWLDIGKQKGLKQSVGCHRELIKKRLQKTAKWPCVHLVPDPHYSLVFNITITGVFTMSRLNSCQKLIMPMQNTTLRCANSCYPEGK